MSKTKTRRRSGLSITVAIILLCTFLTALSWNFRQSAQEQTGSSTGTEPPSTAEPEPTESSATEAPTARDTALPSTEDPLLILVNRDNPLPEDYVVETVALQDFPQSVAVVIYDDLCAMLADGRAEGLSFMICSGYRSTETQERLFNEDMEALLDQGMSYVEAYEQTALYTMPPGCSEHETGLAVDIVAMNQQMLDESQEDTAETRWLHEHCWEYGFILRYPADRSDITGISYESWHYRYVGREAAAYLREHDLTLEEYHSQKTS
ncbi:MAG: M15 family metallopeptidase [Oscillospiraceae bacterium]|nr:M15 family metallopeptidase [Oscillospiraceae bacterium]